MQRDPQLPEGVSARDLEREVRDELTTLGRELAADTGAHLAAVGYFIDSDPERAWAHAVAARRRASRLGIVRETVGLAAYHSGRYADALSELRTARRMTGSNANLPVMADAERGLGRPERALELAHSPEARTLDRNTAIELLIVESGARGDLGQHDAAVVVLQVPELDSSANTATLARLRFAYAEALERATRERDAQVWRERAMRSDLDGTAALYADEDDEILDLLEDADLEDEQVDADEQAPSSGTAHTTDTAHTAHTTDTVDTVADTDAIDATADQLGDDDRDDDDFDEDEEDDDLDEDEEEADVDRGDEDDSQDRDGEKP